MMGVIQWVMVRLQRASLLKRILYGVLLALLLAVLLWMLPAYRDFQRWFQQAPTAAQAIIQTGLMVFGLWLLLSELSLREQIRGLQRDLEQSEKALANSREEGKALSARIDQRNESIDQLNESLRQKQSLLEKTQYELEGSKAAVEALRAKTDSLETDLDESRQRMSLSEERGEDLERQRDDALARGQTVDVEVMRCRRELEVLENRWKRLVDVEAHEYIWRRPATLNAPPFVNGQQRRTRIVSMLNLKGGVGKTTLTANLGACLAMGPSPLRVLLVDLDFQGTLSDQCASGEMISLQVGNANTAAKLLSEESTFDLLQQLAIPVNGVKRASVIIANDQLEAADFRAQTKFFLQPDHDVRFCFRRIFHDPRIANHFDLVLFDCPPRLTTSSINALACSDHVVIPTKLTEESSRAVPRLIKWLKTMDGIVHANVLGVIANNVNEWNANKRGYGLLKADLARFDMSDRILRKAVKSAAAAISPGQGRLGSLSVPGRRLFSGVAEELREKMGI